MGLDMYLYRLKVDEKGLERGMTYGQLLDEEYEKRSSAHKLDEVDGAWIERYSEFMEDKSFNLMYWRKANAIHQFFVEKAQGGVDDCDAYPVDSDTIVILLHRIEKVLADKKMAGELLPSQSGFFFGGTDYDDYYFEELERTRDVLSEALEDFDESNEVMVYRSSW